MNQMRFCFLNVSLANYTCLTARSYLTRDTLLLNSSEEKEVLASPLQKGFYSLGHDIPSVSPAKAFEILSKSTDIPLELTPPATDRISLKFINSFPEAWYASVRHVLSNQLSTNAPHFNNISEGDLSLTPGCAFKACQHLYEWQCLVCDTWNSTSRFVCHNCLTAAEKSLKPRKPPHHPMVVCPEIWFCSSCSTTNSSRERDERDKFFCCKCHRPFGGVGEWICRNCFRQNSRASIKCAHCYSQRPITCTCHICEAIQSIFSVSCHKCSAVPPTFPSSYIISCSSCNQLNESNWEACFSCLKPFVWMEYFHKFPKTELSELEPSTDLPNKHEGSQFFLEKETLSSHFTTNSRPDSSFLSPINEKNAPNTWICRCCHYVYSNNLLLCDICFLPREGETPNSVLIHSYYSEECSISPYSGKTWKCSYCCEEHDFSKAKCCGVVRPASKGFTVCCSCGSVNSICRTQCLKCYGLLTHMFHGWVCSYCLNGNAPRSTHCEICASPHSTRWKCPNCSDLWFSRDILSCTRCSQSCGVAYDLVSYINCPLCHRRNATTRSFCHHCRAVLSPQVSKGDDSSNDPPCNLSNSSPSSDLLPTSFVWICGICLTCVQPHSGEAPKNCPICFSSINNALSHLPQYWSCSKCSQRNSVPQHTHCKSCTTPRFLQSEWANIYCPVCIRVTDLSKGEKCAHCCNSLTKAINQLFPRIRTSFQGKVTNPNKNSL